MKQWTVKAVAGLAALACTSVVQAEDLSFSARVGLAEGGYQNRSSVLLTELVTGTEQQVQSPEDKSWYFASGLQGGVTAVYGSAFADLALEYLNVFQSGTEKDRTDALLTLGYMLDNNWSVFAGYRRGMQGSGAFDDDTFSENGFFVGAGYGRMQLGAVILGTSVAYNFSKAKDFPQDGGDFDYRGVSVKFDLRPQAAPQHGVQLRYQRFSGDDRPGLVGAIDLDGDGAPDPVRADYVKLTESYVQVSYTYSFYF